MLKEFAVAMVSDNHNSFGLRQMILIAMDGEVWKVCANHINEKPVGHVFNIPIDDDSQYPMFSGFGFELCEKVGQTAPHNVIAEAWSKVKREAAG